MNDKVKAYIGFAIRKGSVVFGADSLKKYRKKVYLILCSDTLSENSLSDVRVIGEKKHCEILTASKLEDVVKRNCKVLGICDSQLAFAIKQQFVMIGSEDI